MGAADTALNRAVTKKWLVAAVARIFEPGIKFDYVLTIPGAEGIGKSTFFHTIAGEWFSDSFSFASKDKDKYDAVRAAWIIEISELKGLRRAEVEDAKQFITKETDTYRPAYAHDAKEFPRHCVFAATTNEEFFLKGSDGNRRWWIVKAEGKGHVSQWRESLKANVSQIWAEAYYYYQRHEELCLPEELEKEMRLRQLEYNQAGGDDLFPLIEDFLEKPLPPDWDLKDRNARRNYFVYPDELQAVGTEHRKAVTAEVIINELPDERIRRNKTYSAQKINGMLERCKGWKLSAKKMSPGRCYARCVKCYVWEPDTPEDDI